MRRFLKKTPPVTQQLETKPVIDSETYLSYSQEGEDMVLRRFLSDAVNGFYVDVGAHHPKRFSNTYYFYQLGWHGLNIEADVDLVAEFDRSRPRDINVNAAVGSSSAPLTFYIFNERAVNTFDKKLAQERQKVKGWKLIEERPIPILPLKDILDEYLLKRQKIDFMSVDVEGKDLEVLKSNDWTKYRPRFLLVECYGLERLNKIEQNPFVKYLAGRGYEPVAKTFYTIIFEDKKFHVHD